MTPNKITLNPSTITRILAITAFLLVLASLAGSLLKYLAGHGSIYGLIPLFNVDTEQNIPTFFSTFLLLIAALLISVITILKRNQADSHLSHWVVLSFGFFIMAMDEAATLHELLGAIIHMLLKRDTVSFLNFVWVIPGIALVIVLAIYFLRFFLHLPSKTRLAFLLSASLYLAGAIGLELIEGRYFELYGEDLTYSLMTTIEESLEMAGIIIFNQSLLLYIGENFKDIQFHIDVDSTQENSP